MQKRWPTLLAVIFISTGRGYASNFTFSYGNASQCEDFNISWSGGTAPYQLTIIPSFNRPYTFSIPTSSYSDNHGSYQVQLTLNQSQEMVAVMSDAGGFGSGGVTDVITVGSGNSDCNRTAQAVDFVYDTDMALTQCRLYSFSNYSEAIQPITITGVIPGGTTFVLDPPAGPTDFEWAADISSGTSILFFMTDSRGRSGGSTQLNTVGVSDDATCLTGSFPSSLAVHPSATVSVNSQGSTSTTSANSKTTPSSPVGAIAGGIVGGVLGLGLIAAAVFIYLRRERRKALYDNSGAFVYQGTRPKDGDLDLTAEGGSEDIPPPAAVQPYPYFSPTGSTRSHSQRRQSHGGAVSTASFMDPVSYAESQGYAHPDQHAVATHSHSDSLVDGGPFADGAQQGIRSSHVSTSQDQSISSPSRRKAAMAGVTPYQTSVPRLILHTDAEDVVELPPQYSSLRASSALTETTAVDDSRRASGSSSVVVPSITYPPAPPPIHSARKSTSMLPTPSIIEEDHQTAGLQEPMAPTPRPSPSSSDMRRSSQA